MNSIPINNLVAKYIDEVLDEVVKFRHLCHQLPERTWQEKDTSDRVAKVLADIPGLQVKQGIGKYGLVAQLVGKLPGPVIALRADMDALPIHEQNQMSYKSQNPGVMHACGHDGHMANLYGTILVLSRMIDHIQGTIKFIFQPAEEGGAGAKIMCDEGALENPKVDVIYGLHGWPEAPCGHIWAKTGPILAANSQIKITINGIGCHAAMPHLGTDQVLIGARLIDNLQSISSRSISPSEPIALTFTKFHAGEVTNIIPHEVIIEGTLRTVSESTTELCQRKIEQMTQGICDAHGVRSKVEFTKIYPPTVNHREPTAILMDTAASIFPRNTIRQIENPSMGAEDFSFYLERVPGCFFFLGLDDGRQGGFPSLHHPEFDFNDKALRQGMSLFCHLALQYPSRVTAY